MRDAIVQRSKEKNGNNRQIELSGSVIPAWWIVLSRELADLWIGGKALYLILAFSVLLGIETFVLATNFELSLFSPQEMVFETLKTAIQVSLFIGLIIGADSISGERERGTLEALLLTPASRRQIIIGPFLAGLSASPAALLFSLPFLKMLSQGDQVFVQSLIWGGFVGSLLAIGFTGLGMLVSFWSNSNRVSFFMSLGIYLVILLPTTWPGRAVRGLVAKFFQRINPLEGTNELLEKILVNNRPVAQYQSWLRTPEIFAVLMVGILLLYAGSHLRIDARQG